MVMLTPPPGSHRLTFRGRPAHGRPDSEHTRVDDSLITRKISPQGLALALFLLSYDEYGPTSMRKLAQAVGLSSLALSRALHELRLLGLTQRVGQLIYVSDIPVTSARRAAFIGGEA